MKERLEWLFARCQQTNAMTYIHQALNSQDSAPKKIHRAAHSMVLNNKKTKQLITSSRIRATRPTLYQRSAPEKSTQRVPIYILKDFKRLLKLPCLS